MVLMLAAGWSAHAQMRDYAPGTVRMIITYRCRAIDRPPFLAAMRKEGASRFESWKKEGVLSDYLLLFNTVCDTGTWDMMAILSFDTYQQTMRWYQVEESYPAGLSRELLALATPTTSQLAESRWSFGPPKDRRSAIYMIIPYDHPDRDVYANFVDAVLVPQFDGWMKEGALGAWSIMLTMHYPGKPHDIWLLLEYNGIDGLTHRNGARAATAERLEQQPDWRLLRGISEGFRSEHEVTIARAIVPE
jgi:hypothetical protein